LASMHAWEQQTKRIIVCLRARHLRAYASTRKKTRERFKITRVRFNFHPKFIAQVSDTRRLFRQQKLCGMSNVSLSSAGMDKDAQVVMTRGRAQFQNLKVLRRSEVTEANLAL